MKARHKRFILIFIGIAVLSGATALGLRAMGDGMNLYRSPSHVVNNEEIPKDKSFRLGGLVVKGSVKHVATPDKSVLVQFDVTDRINTVKVRYNGILPDLFKEGQSVVTTGRLNKDGIFIAHEVLAKHDEEYMPKEVEKMIEKGRQARVVNERKSL